MQARQVFGSWAFLAASLVLSSTAGAVTCPTTLVVDQASGPYATISAAVASIPASLTGDVCVDIDDGRVYPESVSIQGIDNNGHRIYVGALAGEPPPTIEPPAGSTAAVSIAVSSVSLLNVAVQFDATSTYGVQVSSDYASLDGVNLSDQGEFIGMYGVLLQASWCAVADSTISISGAIPESDVETIGGDIDSIPVAVFFDGASSSTVSRSYIDSEYGMGLYLNDSNDNEVVASTVAGGLSLPFECSSECEVYPYDSLWIDEDSYSNSIDGSFLDGYGADILGSGNAIDSSTVAFRYNDSLFYACAPDYSNVTLPPCLGSYYYLANGDQFFYGLSVDPGAANNSITRSDSDHGAFFSGDQNSLVANSSITIVAPGFSALLLQGSSGDSVLRSYALSSIAVEIDGSTGTTIAASKAVDPFAAGEPLWFAQQSSSLTLASVAAEGGQYGLLLDAPSGAASVSVATLTFSALSPGATAINFSGGLFVATFSAVSFDSTAGANVGAAALSPGSRITMRSASGPRAGPAYDDDPGQYVQWNWPASLAAAPVPAALPDQVFTATASLTDGVSGAPLPGLTILFDFQGATVAATTNALGVATAAYDAGLLIGTTAYTAAFGGDLSYAAVSASAAVKGTLSSVPPTTSISTPAAGGTDSDLPAFAGGSSDTVVVSTVALSLMDAGAAAPNCYSPATGFFTAPCPAWFAAQGATASWTFSLPLEPWAQGHEYVLYSSATNVFGQAQLAESSAAFTFTSSTPTVFYAGADDAPAGVAQGGQAALIRFSLSSPQGGVFLSSVVVEESGSASDSDVSEVLLYRDDGGVFSPASDALVGAGSMRAGAAVVALSTQQALAPGQPLGYFAVYGVSASADVGATIGARLAAPSDVVVSSGVVPSGVFPTDSRLVPISLPPQPPGITNVSSYPNPVDIRSGPATIAFTLPQAGDVRIRI
ncbi:MAG TPA: hypothetical protein VH309_00415, partial [Elusimicrobiota bacterium]|nr:hypothetical protein [Elusimicrobiota bacterium]